MKLTSTAEVPGNSTEKQQWRRRQLIKSFHTHQKAAYGVETTQSSIEDVQIETKNITLSGRF